MNFEERCRLSEQCLPEAPYKEMLTKLHDEMLEALAQPQQEPVQPPFSVQQAYVYELLQRCETEMRYAGWDKLESDNAARNEVYEDVKKLIENKR